MTQRKFTNPYSSSSRGRSRSGATPSRGGGQGGRSGGSGIGAYFGIGPGRLVEALQRISSSVLSGNGSTC